MLLQMRRAHRFMLYSLINYEQGKLDQYSLFLCVEYYEDVLLSLKALLIGEVGNFVRGTNNGVYGKNNKLVGTDTLI